MINHHIIEIDLNNQDKDGNTILMLAVQAGEFTLVKFLLGKMINLDIKNNRGLTALNLAILYN